MKTLLLFSTYIIGIGEILLGIYFLYTNSKNEIRRVISLFAFSTGIWAILSGITSYTAYSALGRIEIAGVYFFGALLLMAILHLSFIMPYPLIRFDKWHAFLFYLPLLFLAYILFFSRTIILSFEGSTSWAGIIIGGPLFGLYNIISFFIFTSAVITLFYRANKLDGIHKKNLKLVAWSILLGGLPGSIIFFIISTFFPSFYINSLIGVLPSVIWIGVTTYIVLKK